MVALIVSILLVFTPQHETRVCAKPSSWKIHHQLATDYPRFKRALVVEFGVHWKEAAIVSWGEGSWHWWAKNKQYLGTFQMGAREREKYGHSNTLVGQTKAAAKYWRASGKDWSPWDCKP